MRRRGYILKKVLVIGAHGQTGHHIINKLQDTSMTPVAGVRTNKQIKEFNELDIDARLVDVRQTVTEISTQLQGIDAIVFSAGGGMMIDLDGKVKAAQAAQNSDIDRFVLVSAGGIQHFHDSDRLQWMNEYEEYSAAMYYGDMFVLNSDLDYTIIRPEHLTNESGTGKINLGSYLPHNNISREDVAEVVVASLQNDKTIKKAFDIENGTELISDALNNLK